MNSNFGETLKNIKPVGEGKLKQPFESAYHQVIGPTTSPFFNWREFWQYRELFYFFSWRDVKIKYKQTVLGFCWVVLQPLLLMVIFTFFFGRTLDLPSAGLPYPVFVLSGLLIWNTFSAGLTSAAASMINNAAIIRKIYFPKLIIPVSSILVALFDFAMSFVLFLVLLVVYRQPLSAHALWCWPTSLIIVAFATLGPGSWIAALNVKYRDFRYVVPFVVQVLFFLTPVIYPLSLVEDPWMKYAVAFSPVFAAVEFFRFPLTLTMAEPEYILVSIGSTLLFVVLGLGYFRRSEDTFADFA